MKNIYVTELTFTGNYDMPIDQVVNKYNKETWTANDIYELLDEVEDEINYFDRTGSVVSAIIVDKKSLAAWLTDSHQLVNYNRASTVVDDDPDFYYNGEYYKFVWLIREVLSDFIISSIENSFTSPDFKVPSGIELSN